MTIRVSEYDGRALQRVADGDVAREVDFTYRAHGFMRDYTDRVYHLEDNGWVELLPNGLVELTSRGTDALLRWQKAQRQRALTAEAQAS